MSQQPSIESLRGSLNQLYMGESGRTMFAAHKDIAAALDELEGHRGKDGLPLRHVFKSHDGRVVGLIYGLPSFPSEAEAALIIEWLRGGL